MNYFNYFTEIETRFQEARQSSLFLLSPLDWALIESWKDAGVPLDAVLQGIERSFEKRRKRAKQGRDVNSLAYCAQEVLGAAREMAEGGRLKPDKPEEKPFADEDLRAYFADNAAELRRAAARVGGDAAKLLRTSADSLDDLAKSAGNGELEDLESVEQRLAVLEHKLLAVAGQAASEETLLAARREMDRRLAPYRRKMTVDQLARLEKQYLDRAALEALGLPRLSLFYLS